MSSDQTTPQGELADHLAICWDRHLRFKDSKDKITFFIGTLFITVMFGSGFLLFKSYDLKPDDPMKLIFDKLYTVQYVLLHAFFLLLFLYYTYNGIQEKIFLIEAQCCQLKMRNKEVDEVPVPYSLIKRLYSKGYGKNMIFRTTTFKDLANVLMVCIYALFSAVPFLFKRSLVFFNGTSATMQLPIAWIICGLIGMVFLGIIYFSGERIMKDVKTEITSRWKIQPESDLSL